MKIRSRGPTIGSTKKLSKKTIRDNQFCSHVRVFLDSFIE
jgi:hypothetical protein